jgi:ABC-2 type transport system ATP-binding protein
MIPGITPAIRVQQLHKEYSGVTAVEDVTFEVGAGEIFGLLGPNGAGKTTSLKCLCTLTQPDRGSIFIGDIDVLKYPRKARQQLGYVAQEIAQDKVMTGRELLELQAALYHLPSASIADRIAQVLELLDLEEYADRLTGKYSGGLKKRLDLAAGFLHQPSILVLDEPTVGLDIESRTIVWEFLRYLRSEGVTIVITSHYLEEIDALADRVAIIDRGTVIASGTPSELKDRVGGDRITLKLREFCDPVEARSAQSLLELLDVVRSVIINPLQGNSLNLVVQSQPDVLGTIQQALASKGLPLFSLAQSRPSLDDVYLAATGRTLVDADVVSMEANQFMTAKEKRLRQNS